MVNTIIVHVDDESLAESLADCKVGEEKTVTLKVTESGMGRLTGRATDVEGYGSAEEEEQEEAPTEEKRGGYGRGGMPKAIVMIAGGKR